MPYFRCFIEGQNFPGELVKESEPIGFYVTRFIQASSIEEAEQKALENLKQEDSLKNTSNLPNKENARVFFEEIEEVLEEDIPKLQPGFSFFNMKDK